MNLITGSTGFIGSHLLKKIPNSHGLDFRAENKLNETNIDLKDLNKLRDFMFANRFEYVFHNAAVASVPRSYEAPMDFYLNNVVATTNLVDCCRDSGVKKIIFASSSSVNGPSPYGHSKKVCEEIIHMSGINYTILRYFNVFGVRQRSNFFKLALDSILHDLPLDIYGDGETTRDFTYIDNVVKANIKAMDAIFVCGKKVDNIFRPYEVGTGKSTSLNDLYAMTKKALNKEHSKVTYKDERIGDIRFSKANTILDASEIIETEQGVKLCVSELLAQESLAAHS